MSFALQAVREHLNQEIAALPFGQHPPELYEPIRYLMQLGGKRLRPLLTLLACHAFSDRWEPALAPAIGVELFHNFTLMHDDIMDDAPLRRGEPTVHEKWNPNVAILSGDVMLVRAYEFMAQVADVHLRKVLALFSQCAAEVCEGQQLDMNFERRATVSEEEYIGMIRLKTAVLLGFALELGALIGGASEADQHRLREFGVSVGIGFQLKDDLLDVYGDQEKFGKQVGGDIIANKKTFLLIKALEQAEGAQATELNSWLTRTAFEKEEKVQAVRSLYDQLHIRKQTEQRMNVCFTTAWQALEQLQLSDAQKAPLRTFTTQLIGREF
ncbi:geranylgeranyl diphosphate synthase, type II [Catalinimonas alkaloidigena]|uniref:Geranylgeranyl diphosphate synthase, type II n=1 Tax=Catalinimonas alkaloidigena TaxID=1075417 RepID=A0A1G9F6J1_9BACT|nr:polyprenyl synthetase family protein [Catalinimonas alkaloidigena]SDK84002.1 geranylgeranyl diphosphate synthase, type II [Catalinimonas alkaloidigena]